MSTSLFSDTIGGARDTQIRSSVPNSTGSGNILVGPVVADTDLIRGLLEFDLTAYDDMNFTDVSLTLTIDNTDSSSADMLSTVDLFLLNTNFTSSGATWNDPDGAGSGTWGAPGAQSGVDYNATPLGSFTANAKTTTVGTSFTFTDNANFRSAMNASAGSSISFIMISQAEATDRALFRFGNRIDNTVSRRPALTFTAVPVPEPATFSLLLGLTTLAFAAKRRRKS